MAQTYIILVNWNGRDDTIECMESLLRLESDDFAIVVVDNGSTDGSLEALRAWADAPPPARPSGQPWSRLSPERRWKPAIEIHRLHSSDEPLPAPRERITLVDTGRNMGFAAACNLGMRVACQDAEARYFWLLNNDTVVAPDSLSQLTVHAAAHDDQGLIGAMLLYYDRPDIIQGLGGRMDVRRGYADHIGFGLPIDQIPAETEIAAQLSYVMGASMLVRRHVFQQTGGMSERYFLYFEEADWARRLPPGVTQGVCMAARVYHKEGGSIGTSSTARPSNTSIYYLTVNALRFYGRYERKWLPVLLARTAKVTARYALRGDSTAARVTLRAIADALFGVYRRGPYDSPEFCTTARSLSS